MPTVAAVRWFLSSSSRPLAAQCLLAVLGLALVTWICLQLRPDVSLAAAALLYLMIDALLAVNGSFITAVAFAVVALLCLQYFFVAPAFSLAVAEPLELIGLVVFLATALIITDLVSRLRRSLEQVRRSIEEQKRAEEHTRRQAALLDLTHDTVFVRDMNDVITFWNRAAREQYGWTAAEALGKVTHQLLNTEFPAPLDEITAELTRTGRWEGELVHTRRDGAKVVVATRWSLQRNAEGRPVATLETNNDITARKRAEDALLRAQAELAHVTRVTTLGELAASIAHEVNQPLSAIVADANAALNWLARGEPQLEQVRESLLAIVKDSERAAEVLRRIRGLLSRSSHPYEACDLSHVIAETLAFVRADFVRSGVQLQTVISTGLPHVMGDRIQLEQVLLNLLMNAADASKEVTPERRRVIVSAGVEKTKNGSYAAVEVRDAGIGIRDADSARIFDPFYTTKPGGLGMGLSISRSIIERHGGRLWATANPDYGTTFHFSLPALP